MDNMLKVFGSEGGFGDREIQILQWGLNRRRPLEFSAPGSQETADQSNASGRVEEEKAA